MTFKKALKWNVEIVSSANGGYLMGIGCQRFVYGPKDVDAMVADITEYLKDPAGCERGWREEMNKDAEVAPDPVLNRAVQETGYAGGRNA